MYTVCLSFTLLIIIIRWDMSKELTFWENEHGRSNTDIQECALKGTFSCQHLPLLDIKLENIVLDELHLMLCITGEKSLCAWISALILNACFQYL